MLNDEGRAQAAAAAGFLSTRDIRAIYASPAARTSLTAEAISQSTGAPVHFVEGLRERPFGVWGGLFFDEIAQKYPEDYQAWKEDPVGFVPPDGESIQQLSSRIDKHITTLLARHAGDTIAVVTHVGPIRVGIAKAIGLSIDRYRQLTIDYGSVSRIDFGKKQNNLIYLNISVAHRLEGAR